MFNSQKLSLCLVLVPVFILSACRSGDFSQRTSDASVRQAQLSKWLAANESASSFDMVRAPVCSSNVSHPKTGWALDQDDWCVVACSARPADNVFDRWMLTHDGLRCYATEKGSAEFIETSLQQSQLVLSEQSGFTGFDRSFVSNTEWDCKEQAYQIDPDTRKGFWTDLDLATSSYRFYDDGVLMIGRNGAPARLAGDWRGQEGSGILFNGESIFRFSANKGGSRFDDYHSATRRQVCTYKDVPVPRL